MLVSYGFQLLLTFDIAESLVMVGYFVFSRIYYLKIPIYYPLNGTIERPEYAYINLFVSLNDSISQLDKHFPFPVCSATEYID
jgi:hypothetical protein